MVVSYKKDGALIIIYHCKKFWNLCSIIENYNVLWTCTEHQLQPRKISIAPFNNAHEISLRVTITTILSVEALQEILINETILFFSQGTVSHEILNLFFFFFDKKF